ncbi:alpha/beta fold hydrolase [Corynebacterium glucuronolyticum]|uniref:alpha/beta fold hydrolase n=1 Tax=Corynebacterium glucuronolyticum TaxID=39791 RepID=UPI003F6DDA21
MSTKLITWIREWVATATDSDLDTISVDTDLTSLGLSSRDAVVLSGELQNLLDKPVDPTIVYQHPTIAALANALTASPAEPEYSGVAEGHVAAGRDVAIIGLANRVPGADSRHDNNLDTLWNLLETGTSTVGDKPAGRWKEYLADPVTAQKMEEVNLTGGYFEDIASFDAEFFGLSPVEAANMDPQQRIMLELAWEVLENAGYPANTLRGEHVGVFVGSSNSDYGMLVTSDPAEAHPYALTGTASSIIANRISYTFDFRGPSVAVDTACSSSLVAIHQGVRALRDGDADLVLAGGVNVMAAPFISTAFGELGVISPSGGIHAFSASADGFVRGDAAGLFALKRLAEAESDGDHILAVIRGSAVNQDGHSNGLTAPNPDAQVDVLRRAYADAGIDPRQVDYIEAHGTGTILGDPIEAQAIGTVLGVGRDAADPVLIGSAKTNFGHSESAAGATALAKVVLSMQHDTLPPSLGFDEPNPYIDFDGQHLEVVTDAREWPEYSGEKIAGVSGFGFGGTNAHVVVSSYAGDPKNVQQQLDAPAVVTVSGLLPSRRREAATSLLDADLSDPHAVARATARRNHGRSRAAIVATDEEQLRHRLELVSQGKKGPGIEVSDAPSTAGPVFVYTGFGSQHRKMAKHLYYQSTLFKQRIDELDELVTFESGWSMVDIITDDGQTYNTETAQATITAIQIALTDLLAHFGAKPAAVMGMSMGEIAAAYACGGLTAHDAMMIACHRARLMGEGEAMLTEETQGAMAVVEVPADELPDGIEPAVFAGPGMTTVGGPRQLVLDFVDKLDGEGKFARALNVKGAGHTSALDPLLGELAAEICDIDPQPLTIPLFSSVDQGVVYPAGTTIHDADYWLRCTRGSVYFQDATEQAFGAGHNTLVEISPNPVGLMGMMATAFAVGKPDAQLTFALKRKMDEGQTIAELLAKLYAAGSPVAFGEVYGTGPTATLPHTPFKDTSYWTAATPSSSQPGTGTLLSAPVTLPTGQLAFSAQAERCPSAYALLEEAAQALLPGSELVASEDHAPLPTSGEVTVLARKHIGGVNVEVYSDHLLAEGFSTLPSHASASAGAPPAEPPVEIEERHWEPDSGETIKERLLSIVSESMGYEVEDLPEELPLIDLGLDSLMGMRIKNRVENDFQIPPLNVQALRDASVADVVTMVEEAVAGKESELKAVDKQPTPDPHPTPERSEGVGVAPRDASERLVFATWAGMTGAAAAGVTSTLPEIDEETATKIAERLSERANVEITADEVRAARTLEPLANHVREGLETEVTGNVRVLRERPAGSDEPAVFLFHPAGGSSVVYQPLTRRLPDDVPVYGIERLEGSLEDRAKAYLPEIEELAGDHKIILGGWSFGGALAFEVASQLDRDVAAIVLLDTVQPSEKVPDTLEETKARWERYAKFAKKTYGLEFPVPYEMLETQGEDAVIGMLTEFLATTDASSHGLAAGVLEHQRASFVDNRILDKVDFNRWSHVTAPVMLFRAERMHDGAIELEPRYAKIDPDGGWSTIVDDLEIIQLHGDHLGVVDEPEIATVGAYLTRRIKGM